MAEVVGHVHPGFDKVREVFQYHFIAGEEVGSSLCVYYKGQQVVNIWAGDAVKADDTRNTQRESWRRHHLVNVYSCTKALANACIMRLVSTGHLHYDDRVAKYWAEFAQNGKGNITVEQLLSHRAGLSYLDDPISREDVEDWTRYIRSSASEFKSSSPSTLSERLARQQPQWTDFSLGYHPLTRGFYISELVKRVDRPRHRSVSQFFSEEIAVPMGLNMHIGLQTAESEKMQVARLYQLPYDIPESADHHDATQAQVFDQLSLNPSISKPHSSPDKMEVARAFANRQSRTARSFSAVKRFSPWNFRYTEMPSAVSFCTAESMARLYAWLAATHEGNVHLLRVMFGNNYTELKESVVKKALETGIHMKDTVLLEERTVTRGGFNLDSRFPGAFSHGGSGGSFGWGDYCNQVAVGYTPNGLEAGEPLRRWRIIGAVYECVDKLREPKSKL